jgi:hypothetical protein
MFFNKKRLTFILICYALFSLVFLSYYIKSFDFNFIYYDSVKNIIPNSQVDLSKEKIFTNDDSSKGSIKICEPFIKDSVQTYYSFEGIIYPQFVSLTLNKSIDFACLNKNSLKRILLWAKPSWFKINIQNENAFKKSKCPVTNCELLTNKSKINESDFVLVHMREKDISIPPDYRPPNQRWIFIIYESPVHLYLNLSKWNNFFNMTSTYKVDSDFPHIPNIYWKQNINFDENFNFYGNKKKFSVAIISNCKGPSKRLAYIDELKKYINVDIFGKCGMPCPINLKNNKKVDCKEIVSTEYKFYLSFENSICKGYITEKFYEILSYNIIPVVLGGGGHDSLVI